MTSSSSHTSRFHGCAIVAARCRLERARDVDGLSSMSTSMPISTQRATLS
jgi:hypothetical protein